MTGVSAPVPRLVVSDLDGTLLDTREQVTAATRRAIAKVWDAGAEFVIATGRPARWVEPVLSQLPQTPLCICANGGIVYDPAQRRILASHRLTPSQLADIMRGATEVLGDDPGLGFAVERGGDVGEYPDPHGFYVTPRYRHVWKPAGHDPSTAPDRHIVDEEELASQPAVKILVRHDTKTSQQLYAALSDAIPETLGTMTYSINSGLVEISAPGVSKQLGVADIAQLRGISREEIIAFGDMPNDLAMLRYAGIGVAMGNAHPEVLRAADRATGTNDEDGVAAILEELFT